MIARVVSPFKHVNTGVTWMPGGMFEGSDEQVRELARRGFVSTVPEDAQGSQGPNVEPDGGEPEGGRPDAPPLDEMKVDELRGLCAEYGIDVPSKAKKENLVAALRLYIAESEADGGEEPGDGR